MRILKILIVSWIALGMSMPAMAGDLRNSIEQASQTTPQPAASPIPAANNPIPKSYLWLGSGMFVGGLTLGLYAFMHNQNGEFPGYDEYNATNRKLGAAGLFTAFGGGLVLFYGKHRASPSVTFGPRQVTISKRVSW